MACVDPPEYGEGRRWRMEDLAIQTGGVFIAKEAGITTHGVTREMLGQAKRVTITLKRTTITGGCGDAQAIEDRKNQLRHYVAHTDYEFNRNRHAERLAKFVSGVATIRVGGVTETEQWERKMLVEDALSATIAARDEGVVAGGGIALAEAAAETESLLAHLSGDELAGAQIALKACRMPLMQLAANAGKEGAVVLDALSHMPSGTGYDAAQDRYINMYEAGIIDPLRVTRIALDAALSVAGTMLLTEAGVTMRGSEDSE